MPHKTRLLLLAPNCIQESDPEGIVNAKFARALLRAGYQVSLLSALRTATRNRYPAITAGSSVELAAICHPIQLPYVWSAHNVLSHFQAWRRTGYLLKGSAWVDGAAGVAELLLQQHHFDFVISRNPPSELLGLALAKNHGIPWIATWNDPYPTEKYPQPYSGGLTTPLNSTKTRLLKEIARYAKWHLFPCERLRRYMLSYMPTGVADRSSVIPHLVAEHAASKASAPDGAALTIVHTGDLTPPRATAQFIHGFGLFVRQQRVRPTDVKLHFVGVTPPQTIALLQNSSLLPYCEVHGRVDYPASREHIGRADIALLIEADLEEGIFLPCKLVDYVQQGRPIFAVGPRFGTVRDLLGSWGGGIAADCRAPQAISEGLSAMYRSWRIGKLTKEHSVSALRRCFEEKPAIEDFGGVLAAISDAGRRQPTAAV